MRSCPHFFIFVLALIFGALVLFLFIQEMPQESGEGYAVLSVDEALDDRIIGELLAKAGMEYQSESTEGFYISDFSRLRWLPLDTYREELEHFDPRDDGYGEKLKAFFLVEGKRRFFVPLDTANQRSIEKSFTLALGDIPFSLEILGNPRPISVYFIIMAVACIAALIFSREKWFFLPEIPVFLAFSWAGVPGFVLAGILAGLGGLFGGALAEFFPLRVFGSLKDRLKPHRIRVFFGFFFLVLYGILITIHLLPLIPALAGLASFFALGLLALADQRRRGRNAAHIRFMPVPIILKSAKAPVFQPSLVAFAAAAIFALMFPPFFLEGKSGFSDGYADLSGLVLPEDYTHHMAFEAAFSFLPLDRNGSEDYFRYALGDDGLIAGMEDTLPMNQMEMQGEAPPAYPLEKLTDFLLHFKNKTVHAPGVQLKDWISVFLLMIASFPIRFRVKNQAAKKRKLNLLRDRRIAA